MSMMFKVHDGRGVRQFAAGLAILSLMALTVTAWIVFDVHREQEIVSRIVQHLPASDLAAARELSGDLRLQSRLSVLLVLNIFGTAIAFGMLVRGYLSSEQTLRDVKVLSADILASMDVGVITTDRLGRVTSINPRSRELIHLTDESIGRPLAEIGHEHALLVSICCEVRDEHNCIRDRDYCVNEMGHVRTFRAGCTLLRNDRNEEIGTVIHVRDVTQKALMEDRLRRMERYSGLGSLAAGLQHEIKNPLSALSLHIQLLRESLAQERPNPQTLELLDVLHTEVHRINKVLDGFRNYASMTVPGRAPVDVTELIDKLVRLLRPQAEKQKVKIEFRPPAGLTHVLQADSVRLEQVFLNLALNALSAMPEGGTLTFRVRGQSDALEIDVEDSGHGIPPEIQSQIFDPYFTTRYDGTGMGLALCDKIVRQHAGSIDVRTGSQGTVFTVLLPWDLEP